MSADIIAGNTVALSADVEALPGVDTSVTWSSADATIAAVNDSGIVTGESQGRTYVRAVAVADPSKRDSAQITVDDTTSRIISIRVKPSSATVEVADTFQFQWEMQLDGDATTGVTWSTVAESIATVDDDGLVTGESVGTTEVVATSDFDPSKSDSATVEVIEPRPDVQSVSVSPSSVTVEVNGSAMLTASVEAEEGADTSVQWSSSNESVVTVAPDGKTATVTGESTGTATVTASSVQDPSKSGAAEVKVESPDG